jgi:YbbR domain-containing protein
MNKLIRQLFIENYKIKLFSLVCALVLWFYVNLDNEYEHTFYISVKTINQSTDKILVEPLPETIPVRFQGRGMAFINPKFRTQHFELDLSQYPDNAQIIPALDMIKSEQSRDEVKPIQIMYKKNISLSYDRFITKTVPVIGRLGIKPAEGHTQVGDIIFMPDSVTIQGAAKQINSISAIYTESRSLQASRSVQGEIRLSDSTAAFRDHTANSVRFFADIQRIGERMFVDVPVVVSGYPDGEKITAVPSTFSIKLQGGVEVLKELKREDIVATIDYQNRHRYGRRIPALIHVPQSVSFTEVNPKDFELLVEK